MSLMYPRLGIIVECSYITFRKTNHLVFLTMLADGGSTLYTLHVGIPKYAYPLSANSSESYNR